MEGLLVACVVIFSQLRQPNCLRSVLLLLLGLNSQPIFVSGLKASARKFTNNRQDQVSVNLNLLSRLKLGVAAFLMLLLEKKWKL